MDRDENRLPWGNKFLSPDGERLALLITKPVGAPREAPEEFAILLDLASGKETPLRVQDPKDKGAMITWSPAGQRLASVHGGKLVRIWDAATGKELFTLYHWVKTLDFIWSLAKIVMA